MTDLSKSTATFKSELAKNIESKVIKSKLSLSELEKELKAYSEEVKAVIRTITEEGNYQRKLIDQKVEGFVKKVHAKEQKA